MADGLFDEAKREVRGEEGQRDHEHLKIPGAARGAVGVGEQLDDGIVPKIQRIGTLPEPDQGPCTHDARDEAALRRNGRNRGSGEDGDQQDAAIVGKRAEAIDEHHEEHKPRNAAEADRLPEQPSARHLVDRRRAPALEGPHEGEPTAEQDAHEAGVGAVIDARGIFTGHVEHRHEDGGEGGEDEQNARDGAPAAAQPGKQKQHRGPNQIELPLDGERPVARKRARLPGRGEIRFIGENLRPVNVHEKRGQNVVAHFGEEDMVEEDAEGGSTQNHGNDRGHEPAYAPDVEARNVNSAGARELLEEAAGNKVTANDKERGNAHEAALGERVIHVVEEHAEAANGAEAVNGVDIDLMLLACD